MAIQLTNSWTTLKTHKTTATSSSGNTCIIYQHLQARIIRQNNAIENSTVIEARIAKASQYNGWYYNTTQETFTIKGTLTDSNGNQTTTTWYSGKIYQGTSNITEATLVTSGEQTVNHNEDGSINLSITFTGKVWATAQYTDTIEVLIPGIERYNTINSIVPKVLLEGQLNININRLLSSSYTDVEILPGINTEPILTYLKSTDNIISIDYTTISSYILSGTSQRLYVRLTTYIKNEQDEYTQLGLQVLDYFTISTGGIPLSIKYKDNQYSVAFGVRATDMGKFKVKNLVPEIPMTNLLKVREITVDLGKLAANTAVSKEVILEENPGYTPIGIIGYHSEGIGDGTSNISYVNLYKLYLDTTDDGSKIIISYRGMASSAAAVNSILYIKYLEIYSDF